MSYDALRNDLEGAKDLGVAVQLHMSNGETLLTGLHHWPADEPWFSVHDPQTLGDFETTRKVFKDQVSSWSLTDVSYGLNNPDPGEVAG